MSDFLASELMNLIHNILLIKAIDWIREKMEAFEPIQWALFLLGCILIGFGLYSAWKSYRIASYKVSVSVAKFGFILIVFAFAWENVRWIYDAAMEVYGNPILAFAFILAGGFLGVNVIKLILARNKK